MRLTVGPLPAAVYWRRRAVVLVGVAMIVLIISYACGDSSGSTAGADTSAGASQTFAIDPTATSAAEQPGTPTAPTASPTEPQAAFTLPGPVGTGACTDAEIEVTATAATPQVRRDEAVDVTIKIKNVSSRTCSRDVGADVQELSIGDGTVTIWSSDDCGSRKGTDVRSFEPSTEFSFTSTWSGRRSRAGTGAVNCFGLAPDAAVYQLVARLDQKVSAPFAIRIVN
jgi:hypothetical protein